ncbi:MAG: hypothetical protein M1552_01620 [Firmicutes bacterium]|nr:hypothetical protein [Bacillota bacterium]MCL5992860.1 hypothetical protein [Bacillota bacterium]
MLEFIATYWTLFLLAFVYVVLAKVLVKRHCAEIRSTREDKQKALKAGVMFLKHRKAIAFLSIKVLIWVFLFYYFSGLLVYRNPYSNFVQNRQSGVPFELMTIFDFDQISGFDQTDLRPQISSFFGRGWDSIFLHGMEHKTLWIYGLLSFPDPRSNGGWPPLSMHAIWGETVEDKLKILERLAYSAYLPKMQWVNNRPSTGHDTLTHIATRTEVVSPVFLRLFWKEGLGETRETVAREVIFTTDIYNIHNIWLLFHTLTPLDADPQLLSFLNTEKQRLLMQAKDYHPGNVNRDILFYGLKEMPWAIVPYPADPFLTALLVWLPTLPAKWFLFAPMFYVPYEVIGRVAWVYYYFLVLLGVVAVSLILRAEFKKR